MISLGLQLAIASSAGLMAGLFNGMLGIGGGIIMVPLFFWVFRLEGWNIDLSAQLAMATSLGIVSFSSLSASIEHYRQGFLKFNFVFKIAPFAVLGIALAAWIKLNIRGASLMAFFAFFLFYVGFQLIYSSFNSVPRHTDHFKAEPRQPRPIALIGIGFATGMLSSLLGIGGGILLVPSLNLFLKIPMRSAVANSIGVIFWVATLSALSHVIIGLKDPELQNLNVPGTWGYVRIYWVLMAAPFCIIFGTIGSRLAKRVSPVLLKRILGTLAFLVSLRTLGEFILSHWK